MSFDGVITPSNLVTAVAFCPNGQYILVASNDGSVDLWCPSTRAHYNRPKIKLPLKIQDSPILHISISPDGKNFATASEDRTIRLWDFVTFKSKSRAPLKFDGPITSISFNPCEDRNQLAVISGCGGGKLYFWDLQDKFREARAHGFRALSYRSDGEALAVGIGSSIEIWDTMSRQRDERLPSSSDGVITNLSFIGTNSIISLSENGIAKLWRRGIDMSWTCIVIAKKNSLRDINPLKPIPTGMHPLRTTSLSVSLRGGRIGLSFSEKAVHYRHLPDGGVGDWGERELKEVKKRGEVRALAWSPDGEWLAVVYIARRHMNVSSCSISIWKFPQDTRRHSSSVSTSNNSVVLDPRLPLEIRTFPPSERSINDSTSRSSVDDRPTLLNTSSHSIERGGSTTHLWLTRIGIEELWRFTSTRRDTARSASGSHSCVAIRDWTGYLKRDGSAVGSEGSSRTYKGRWINLPLFSGRSLPAVAIKVVIATRGADRHIIRSELSRWGSLSHPNTLPLLGSVDESDSARSLPSLVLPWVSNGSAIDFFSRYTDYPRERRETLVMGLARGLEYIHSRNPPYPHGDIRPTNIFINENESILLGVPDFSGRMKRWRWMAPELFMVEAQASKPTAEADVFAFALTGWYLLTEDQPFSSSHYNELHLLKAAIVEGHGLPWINNSDDWLKKLLARCWGRSARERPNSNQLLTEIEDHLISDGAPRQTSKQPSFTTQQHLTLR